MKLKKSNPINGWREHRQNGQRKKKTRSQHSQKQNQIRVQNGQDATCLERGKRKYHQNQGKNKKSMYGNKLPKGLLMEGKRAIEAFKYVKELDKLNESRPD